MALVISLVNGIYNHWIGIYHGTMGQDMGDMSFLPSCPSMPAILPMLNSPSSSGGLPLGQEATTCSIWTDWFATAFLPHQQQQPPRAHHYAVYCLTFATFPPQRSQRYKARHAEAASDDWNWAVPAFLAGPPTPATTSGVGGSWNRWWDSLEATEPRTNINA